MQVFAVGFGGIFRKFTFRGTLETSYLSQAAKSSEKKTIKLKNAQGIIRQRLIIISASKIKRPSQKIEKIEITPKTLKAVNIRVSHSSKLNNFDGIKIIIPKSH